MLSLLRHKLGALLVRWGRRLEEDQDDAVSGQGNRSSHPASPPEHWLRLVRERAPQLLEPSQHGRVLNFSSASLRSLSKNVVSDGGHEQASEELSRARGPFQAPDGQQSRMASDVVEGPTPLAGGGRGQLLSLRPWKKKEPAESFGHGQHDQCLSSRCATDKAAGESDRLLRADSATSAAPPPSRNAEVRPIALPTAGHRQDVGLRRRSVLGFFRDLETAEKGGLRAVSVAGQGVSPTSKAEPFEPPRHVGRSSGPEKAEARSAQEPVASERRRASGCGLLSPKKTHDRMPRKNDLFAGLLHFDKKRKKCGELNPQGDEKRAGQAGAGNASAAKEGTEHASWADLWRSHAQVQQDGECVCKNAQPSDAWEAGKSHDLDKACDRLPDAADSCSAGVADAWPFLKDERRPKSQPCVDAACPTIPWPLLPSEEQRSLEAFEPPLLLPEQHFSARKQQELLGTLWNA